MIIISDCFTAKVDEGCLKVVNSIAKRIKAAEPETTVISYDRDSALSDYHLALNKLFLNFKLFLLIWMKKDPILYIPFASNTMGTIIRSFVLALISKRPVYLLPALKMDMNLYSKSLLKLSRANIIALSRVSYDFYYSIIGKRAHYLKTGVDTEKFIPVSIETKIKLKEKYGIPSDKKVVLHVGHLKANRNIETLSLISTNYFVVLVVSSVTEPEKDPAIRKKMEGRSHTKIIEEYIDNIQEIYQMADVYLFPVQDLKSCIDIPLSVLEAAACNVPIVTTPYGELAEFVGNEGFYVLNTCNSEEVNTLIEAALNEKTTDTRKSVLKYDWMRSTVQLEDIIKS